ncbi:ABC transporter ATP-binding protein [Herbaspirillum sp. YR522]|uniref:ABC transporter ATP-binding protein n=1 Tax=Herbaspirillum sp. YR522 TaxID=1144342 RepID=UPI00026FA254|nr:ABC transporter ATP-binding protein [Herbaspirillum sp. YR522]EJN08907.1 ATPase component of various ABC-type transport systems with duplicated ATPase domain [Herbaspirillum sp. YR522]
MNALLSIQNLTIDLPTGGDRAHALARVELEVRAGEILCVVGESGSGKSLTAAAVLGLLPDGVEVAGGRIDWDGEDLLTASPERLRRLRGKEIGMIFQEPMTALNPLHTIGDQIGELLRAHTRLGRRDIQEKILALLASVHIASPAQAARAYPHQLSGGQRQRAMIAMALALEPRLLIADEPTTALDVTTQAQILKLIHDLQRRRGTAVLFITHDFGVVADIADRVAVMQKGVLVETGPAQQVLDQPRHPYTRALIAAVPPLRPALRNRPDSRAAALTITGLSKTYGKRGWSGREQRVTHALDNVSLDLPAGSTLGIVGESGSGKSTLARNVLGLLLPDAGEIRVFGTPVELDTAAGRRRHASQVQMVFQDPYGSLNPRRRVGDIVTQGPIAHGSTHAAAWKKARELFDLVGLAPDALERYPHEFSGGQRQRIGLARALAMEPRILVADEPVSALDVSVQAQVLALLARLQDQLQLSILFITHDLRVAAQVCDRIAVMKAGQVVEVGDSSEIFDHASHSYTRALLAAVPGRHWTPGALEQELVVNS